MGRRVTERDLAHIIRRRKQGATRQAIATELGVSPYTVRRHLRLLRAQGIDIDPPESAPRSGDPRPHP